MEMNYKLEDLSDEELFRIQNKAYELIKERNLKKGDLEEIVDKAFKSSFPKR